MPTVRASTPVNLQGYTQVSPQAATQAMATTESAPLSRSTMMHASMPLMASTSDAFVRQFYSQQNIPQQRILPAKRGS